MPKSDIQNLIKEFFQKLTIPAAEISVDEDGSKTCWFSVEVKDSRFADHAGEAIFAVNHLIRKMIESKGPETESEGGIIIDINGFQKKRVENIRSVAHMMAERARYFKSSVEVDPMPAFERRVIHEFLSDAIDLKTESQGMGPGRRVVIKYVGGL